MCYSYTVQVWSKITSSNRQDLWSYPVETIFQTHSRQPEAPTTDAGAFYVDQNNLVTVYWVMLEAQQQHSPRVRYGVQFANRTEK